jgi:hypothetical protein
MLDSPFLVGGAIAVWVEPVGSRSCGIDAFVLCGTGLVEGL